MTLSASSTRAAPRVAKVDRRTATRLAETEYGRVEEQLRALDRDAWKRPTCCPGWDVRAMAGHTLGMAEMAASVVESVRQQRAAKKSGGTFIDALTAYQVATRADLSTTDLVKRMARVGPKAATGRRRAPGIVRRRTMVTPASVGGPDEVWTLGFLFDTILTRDPWMHRLDIADATGIPLVLTAEHDGVLVADVAHEWAERHSRPCTLTLAGPAGGSFTFGSGGPQLEADALAFCRAVSGRSDNSSFFSTPVPF